MRSENWGITLDRFEAWWRGDCIDRPMLRVVAKRDGPIKALEAEVPFDDEADFHLNVDKRLARFRNHLRSHRYMAEAYANFSVDIGPGSMAIYLGSNPRFAYDTVWFEECLDEADTLEGRYDPNNPWLLRHLDMARRAQAAAGTDFLVNIPDIIENMDIYAALRGPQDACYDLIDEPETVLHAMDVIDETYMRCYQAFYDIVSHPEGLNSFTAFNVLGRGRIAKIQCDFCALMSPKQFRRFVQPSLKKQAEALDHTVYHLDGPDAIKHLEALMEIEALDALQWTCGAGQPDSGSPRWYPIYDRVRDAGKALHLSIYDGDFEQWLRTGDELVGRYGPKGLYFLFPEMTEAQAERLIAHAEDRWRG